MKDITFEYRDEYSHGKWKRQHCIVSSLDECIRIYDLNECEYKIIKIKEIKN